MSSIRVAPAFLLASLLSACGSGAGSNGVPVTPAQPVQPVMNSGTSQSVTSASHVAIQEIPISAAFGLPMDRIAVAPDSSVYVPLCCVGAAANQNTPRDNGLRYANGSFQELISADPFAPLPEGQAPPLGPVATTRDSVAHFAAQISDPMTGLGLGPPDNEEPAIASYEPGSNSADFTGPLDGFLGVEISDMAGDSKGNLWYAVSPVSFEGGPGNFATVVNGQTQVQLGNNPNRVVQAMTVGPEGYAWAATAVINSSYGRSIYRISPAGAIVHTYNTPLGASIGGMAVAGDVWFTDSGRNAIGKLAYGTGTFSRYPIPTPASGVNRIVLGGDGALWFTESKADKIGRITTNGTITEYAVPTPNAGPSGIAAGPTGAGKPKVIWFVESGKLGKITIP